MIKIENLSVGFDDHFVLENINLEIPKNETTLIVGQSGTGKSVLIKTIEGLIKPCQGKIFIEGTDIFSLKHRQMNKIRRKLGMLFQDSALLDSYNVFQNVALPLVEHTKLSDKEILFLVEKKLQFAGLKNILQKMPHELSGGMKKRVALARAIIMEPEYIIYDEPTTGLDTSTAEDIIKLIKKMQNDLGITSIIITHDLNCIKKTAGKIIMLSSGKIIFDGNWQDFNNASKLEIRNFLGKN